MKVLFITDFLLAEEQGAKQSAKAHYYTLKEIFGEDGVDVVALNSTYEPIDKKIIYWERKRSKQDKLKSILQFVPFLLSKRGEDRIIEICKENAYSCVFVDHSIYGNTIEKIKKAIRVPVVAYFHGIMQYQNQEYKRHNKISLFYFLPAINMKQNEIKTVKYSDKCLVLNERDNENFKRYYKKCADEYLPVYYMDNAKICKKDSDKSFKLLFVGGYFWPNIHGITWFVNNVMSELPDDVFLIVVGNNMEKLKNDLSKDNIIIHGRVDCLDDFYNDADVVIGPIFEGEGMKTKTCEALMYGKLYLGTDEALEGYEGLDDFRCNTKEEFISQILKIRNTQVSKYHDEMRELYLKMYSPQMARKKLNAIFNEWGIQEKNYENSNDHI